MRTMMDEFVPGDTVPVAGVYGLYFLGEYMADARALGRGDTFEAAAVGVTYRLHATF